MGLLQEGIKRQEISGQLYVDYRDFSDELFLETFKMIEEDFCRQFGKELSDGDKIKCKQALALGVVLNQSPFNLKNRNSNINILGIYYKEEKIRSEVVSWFQGNSIAGKFLKGEVNIALEYLISNLKDRDLIIENLSLVQRQKRHIVIGDPNHAVMLNGLSATISPEDPRLNTNSQSFEIGDAYDA